jgi:hypothetical protein
MMSIDPGVSGTGWVVWDVAGTPLRCGVVTPRRAPHALLIDRCMEVIAALRAAAEPGTLRVVVCEYPEYQESTVRAMTWTTGDMQKMTFLVGVIAHWAVSKGAMFVPVTPTIWKGQLPKTVVQQRIVRQLGEDVCARLGLKTHAWDAAGIGIWALHPGTTARRGLTRS